jgi:hypothetical protein
MGILGGKFRIENFRGGKYNLGVRRRVNVRTLERANEKMKGAKEKVHSSWFVVHRKKRKDEQEWIYDGRLGK